MNGYGISRRNLLLAAGAAPLSGAGPSRQMRGIIPILATPFTETKEVDYEDLEREVRFLDRCGVHGMVWPQQASEYQKLTKEERLRGMEVVARAHRGMKAALVLGVQGETAEEAVAYTRAAEKLEPDAVIAIPPKRAASLEDYRAYYKAIALATARPVIVQTSGGAEGLEPKIEFLVALAKEYPHLGYFKEEWPPIVERMIELGKHRPTVRAIYSGGGGRGMTYEWRLGMDGTMPGSPYADLYVRVWDAWQARQFDRAREIFSKLALMLNCENQVGGTRQHIMKIRGVFKTTVSRLRTFTLTPAAIAEIEYHWEASKPYLKA